MSLDGSFIVYKTVKNGEIFGDVAAHDLDLFLEGQSFKSSIFVD